MADNQSNRRKKKRRTYVKDGVVLKVADIEKECQRLRRRPRAALYPLLPITEPLKLKRKSIHIGGKTHTKRHRKHCRKRVEKTSTRQYSHSRSRLVAATSTSDISSVSRHHHQPKDLWSPTDMPCSSDFSVSRHNQPKDMWLDMPCSSNFGSVHQQPKDMWLDMPCSSQQADWTDLQPSLWASPEVADHHKRHHHYHIGRQRPNRICHHDPLLVGRRTFATTSLKDLRGAVLGRHRGRRTDPEAGDKDSTASNQRSRKIVSFIVASVASFILMMCVALVAVTLRLTPAIDELVRKGNEEIYRSMSAGASTSSPTTEAAVANTTTPTSGTPG